MESTDPKTGMVVLEEDECWRLLAEVDVGRLAVSLGGHPEIFPINHVVDGRTVVFRSREGTKLAGAVLGLSVAFEVDSYDSWTGDAWSVVVKGTAEDLRSTEAIDRAEQLPLSAWWAVRDPVWVVIRPTEVSGRRFRVVVTHPAPSSF